MGKQLLFPGCDQLEHPSSILHPRCRSRIAFLDGKGNHSIFVQFFFLFPFFLTDSSHLATGSKPIAATERAFPSPISKPCFLFPKSLFCSVFLLLHLYFFKFLCQNPTVKSATTTEQQGRENSTCEPKQREKGRKRRKKEGRRRLLVLAVLRGLHPRDALGTQSLVPCRGLQSEEEGADEVSGTRMRCVISQL